MATQTTADEHEPGFADGSRSRRWLSQARAFSERSLREVLNSWILLGTVVALAPGMQLLFSMQGGDVPETMLASWAVGTGVFGAVYICLYVFGYQLATDLEDRRYEAYRSMPISPSADLGGRMFAGFCLAAVAFGLTLVAGVLTGASFGLRGPESIPIVLGAFALTCVFWMIVALPFIAAAKNERVAEYAVPMIAVAGYVLTGLNGVNAEMSPIDGELMNYLPNTLPTRLMVYHLVPGEEWVEIGAAPPALPAGPEYLLALFAYAAVALVVGTVLLNKVLYKRGWWP
ncbi:ABC transporter permease [Halostagnicola bangensis]